MATAPEVLTPTPPAAPPPPPGRRMARDVAWTLAGQAWPLAVGILAMRPLVRGLGDDRFGLLTIAWLFVGYLGLFDLGLGRVLTKVVAERIAQGRAGEVRGLVEIALALMLALGAIGAALGAAAVPTLVGRVLSVPPGLQAEGRRAMWLLALSLPFVVGASGLRGVLEAQRRFGVVNVVNALSGTYTYLGPLAVLSFAPGLVPAVAALLAGRVILMGVYMVLCFGSLPRKPAARPVDVGELGSLLRLGGWMTVTNVVSPVMVYLDRLMIGAAVAVGAVTYYAVPYDAVTRLSIIPSAIARVLFPAFAAGFAADPSRVGVLYGRGLKASAIALVPIAWAVAVLAPEGLSHWMGPEFARRGTVVLRWLAAGVAANGVAQVPFLLLQGRGRADLTARLHLAELVVYLPALWLLIRARGVEGAAIAWTLRAAADAAALLALAGRGLVGAPRRAVVAPLAACALPLVSLALPTMPLATKAACLTLSLAAMGVGAWSFVLSADDRAALLGDRRLREVPT